MTCLNGPRVFRSLALVLAASLLAGCGDSATGPGPGPGGNNQTASLTATLSSATIARCATTSTTVVFLRRVA